jgi:predicted permease
VGFVLLIACSNIAGLMLARASGRAKEIAIRAALGAGQWHLIRQSMAESLVLAFSGALGGLALAYAGIRALLVLAPENSSVALGVRVDGPVLLFTTGAAIAAGLLFGMVPAWQITRIGRYDSLKEGGRAGTAGMGRQRVRAALVIGEVALALMLLVAAGLFIRSLAHLQYVNPGFDPRGVMSATLALPDAQYHDPDKRVAFYRAVLEKLSNLPGVTTAAAGLPVPFSGMGGSASFRIEGRPQLPGDPGPHGDIRYVSPTFFSALKIPLRSGRVFTEQDRRGGQPVVLIDDTLARQYWPNEDPIGKRMRNGSSGPWYTVAGVVGHVKRSDLAGDTEKGTYYYSMFQRAVPFTTFLARTDGDPAKLAGSMREAVQAIDPTQPVSNVKTLSDMVSNSLAPRRFIVTVLGFFAGVALLMAVLGLYGVISYSVAQRTQELGIRMALGAQRRDVLGLVIGQGMRLAALGAVIGLLASIAASRVLRNQLFQVSAFDPLTFSAMAAVLICAALLASYVPAQRATRVDPTDALRYE